VFAGLRRDRDGQRLVKQASPRLTPVMLDVTDAESISQAAARIREESGTAGLAGLVNNAGTAGRPTTTPRSRPALGHGSNVSGCAVFTLSVGRIHRLFHSMRTDSGAVSRGSRTF